MVVLAVNSRFPGGESTATKLRVNLFLFHSLIIVQVFYKGKGILSHLEKPGARFLRDGNWVDKQIASAIQDNYPSAPERTYYRLTNKGIQAGDELWSNPLSGDLSKPYEEDGMNVCSPIYRPHVSR